MRRSVLVTVRVAIDSDEVTDHEVSQAVDSALQLGLAVRDTDVGGSYFDHTTSFVADEIVDYNVS